MISLMVSALLMGAPTADAEAARYYPMLEAVRSEDVVLPITKCAQAKITAYIPPAPDVGDLRNAAALLNTSLETCGFQAGSNTIKASLKSKYPQLSPTEVDRASQHAFAIPVVMLLGQAAEQLKVPSPRRLAEPPVLVPCPPEPTKDPKHPCFERK